MQDDTWCRTMGVTKEQKVSHGQGLLFEDKKHGPFVMGRLDGPLMQRVLGGSHDIVTAHVLKLNCEPGIAVLAWGY
jgi:hypothetical protein